MSLLKALLHTKPFCSHWTMCYQQKTKHMCRGFTNSNTSETGKGFSSKKVRGGNISALLVLKLYLCFWLLWASCQRSSEGLFTEPLQAWEAGAGWASCREVNITETKTNSPLGISKMFATRLQSKVPFGNDPNDNRHTHTWIHETTKHVVKHFHRPVKNYSHHTDQL